MKKPIVTGFGFWADYLCRVRGEEYARFLTQQAIARGPRGRRFGADASGGSLTSPSADESLSR